MADKNQIYFSRHIVCDDLSRLMKEHMPEEVTFGRNADFPKELTSGEKKTRRTASSFSAAGKSRSRLPTL